MAWTPDRNLEQHIARLMARRQENLSTQMNERRREIEEDFTSRGVFGGLVTDALSKAYIQAFEDYARGITRRGSL